MVIRYEVAKRNCDVLSRTIPNSKAGLEGKRLERQYIV